MPAHQATCVAIGERAILIEGEPGSGKSSLALALIDRGAQLVGDDGVWLDVTDRRLIARPCAATRGLIEVRNVGLFDMPVCPAAPVALVLVLDPEAPRFVEAAESTEREGVPVPLLRLRPGSPVMHLKAELALQRYGLSPG